jgi:hypothetical protein
MNKIILSSLAALALAAGTVAPISAAPLQQGTKPVDWSNTDTYEHDKGWFTIEMPKSWNASDKSKDDEAIVSFTDETENAGLVIDVFAPDKKFTDRDVSTLASSFVKDRFSKFAKYKAGKLKKVATAHYGQLFSYDQKIGTGTYRIIGETYVKLHDDAALSIVTYLIPQDQYDDSQDAAYKVIDSLTVNTDTVLGKESGNKSTGDVEQFGDLASYKHPKNVFSIKVPENWTKEESAKTGKVTTIFSNPDGLSFIMIEAYKNSKAAYKTKELISVLDDYVDDTIGKNVKDYEANDSKEVNSNATSKVFSFTVEQTKGEKTQMVGIMYLIQNGSAIAFVRIVVPANSVEANEKSLNSISDSFTLTKNAKL